MKRLSMLLPALFLVGCQGADSTPGAANPAEAEQLNDAAAMLDANSVDINAVTANSMDQDQPQ
ncbi:MAG: hypothetical protein ABIO86_07435 [Sphingomonas sp.]